MFIIATSRERFLKEHFFELSFEQKQPDPELFKTLTSLDQFYIAANHNWDDGPGLLHWIIDSPRCDKGTASVIFWSAQPDYYLERAADTMDEEEKEIFDLLQKIIHKFKHREFKRGWLKFDPRDEAANFDGNLDALPRELTRATSGIRPFCLSAFGHYLQQLKKQFSSKQRNRNKKRKTRSRY